MLTRIVALAAVLTLAAACAAPGMKRIDPPAAPGAGEPNLAVGADGRLYLSWIEPHGEGHTLRFSGWTGDGWSEARTIASGDDWFVNWADFPSMTASGDGTLLAHWLRKSSDGKYAYDVNVSLSNDGGTSWSEPFTPHDDGTATEHGFASLLPLDDGNFQLLWLDGRETAIDAAGRPLGSGVMTLRSATLAPDGTLSAGAVVDGRVCDCCSTDAVVAGSGTVVTVFRDRSEDEIRDISSSRLERGEWSPPERIHEDGWRIAACPVNGPALAAAGDRVAGAWFTAPDQQGRVIVAFSEDGGKSFGEPVRVDSGAPVGRVDVVLAGDGTAIVSWLESRSIQLRWVGADGDSGEPIRVALTEDSRAAGFPRLALVGDEIFVAWTEPAGEGDEPRRLRAAVLPAHH